MGNSRPGMFKSTGIVAIAVAIATLGALAQTSQLRLVSTVWPPFTNAAGQPRFALDLVEAALDRIGIKSQTTFVDAAQFTPSILSGAFDGSGAAWQDAERERVLLFSRPYLENRLILVARRGGDVSATSLAALKGTRIAIVEGYAYGESVENAGPTYLRSKSEEDSLRLLLDGAVDYVLMDDLVVQYIVSNHPEEAKTRLQVGSTPLVTRPLYFAVRRSLPDAQSIIDRFNAQLTTMISDRTYHRLLHVDWLRADIDGDGVAEYIAGSDRSGPAEPQRVYNLFSATEQPKPDLKTTPRRYFFGGNIYNGWQTVPNEYKVWDNVRTDPSRSAFRVFTFTWK
jgi:polar amino acid transport system substrate-binding protein